MEDTYFEACPRYLRKCYQELKPFVEILDLGPVYFNGAIQIQNLQFEETGSEDLTEENVKKLINFFKLIKGLMFVLMDHKNLRLRGLQAECIEMLENTVQDIFEEDQAEVIHDIWGLNMSLTDALDIGIAKGLSWYASMENNDKFVLYDPNLPYNMNTVQDLKRVLLCLEAFGRHLQTRAVPDLPLETPQTLPECPLKEDGKKLCESINLAKREGLWTLLLIERHVDQKRDIHLEKSGKDITPIVSPPSPQKKIRSQKTVNIATPISSLSHFDQTQIKISKISEGKTRRQLEDINKWDSIKGILKDYANYYQNKQLINVSCPACLYRPKSEQNAANLKNTIRRHMNGGSCNKHTVIGLTEYEDSDEEEQLEDDVEEGDEEDDQLGADQFRPQVNLSINEEQEMEETYVDTAETSYYQEVPSSQQLEDEEQDVREDHEEDRGEVDIRNEITVEQLKCAILLDRKTTERAQNECVGLFETAIICASNCPEYTKAEKMVLDNRSIELDKEIRNRKFVPDTPLDVENILDQYKIWLQNEEHKRGTNYSQQTRERYAVSLKRYLKWLEEEHGVARLYIPGMNEMDEENSYALLRI